MTPPPERITLHIGTLKSGTSYLQSVLWGHRAQLYHDGVLFPGETSWGEQVEAVRALLREGKPNRRQIDTGAWDAMSAAMLAWSGSAAIMSVELLSLASRERVERAVASLRPAELRVVITVRDLARVIPSSWQETVQNRQTWTWPEFVDGLVTPSAERSTSAERFWKQQDVPLIARTWGEQVGLENVHVVVVPRSGSDRDDLWRRFAPVVGIDPAAYPAPADVRGNPAVGAASAEFLRRLNVHLGKRFDIVTYERHVKHHLAKRTLAGRAADERLHLPAEHEAWAHARALELVAAIEGLGVPVHGDLAELVPEPGPPGRPAVDIAEADVAAAGVHAVEALVRAIADAPGGSVQAPATTPSRGLAADDPVRAARRARRQARRGAP